MTQRKALPYLIFALLTAAAFSSCASGGGASGSGKSGRTAIDGAIEICVREIESALDSGLYTAVLSFQTHSPEFSTYLMEEFMGRLLMGGKVAVVDRQNTELVEKELRFSASDYADSNNALNTGKMTGAQAVVTGAVTDTGSILRLTVKAFDTQTSEQLSQSTVDINKNRRATEILAGIDSSNIKAKSLEDYLAEFQRGLVGTVSSINIINEGQAEKHLLNATYYSNSQMYDESIEELTKAISINPVFGVAYIERALAYENKGDLDAAILNYNFVINLAPTLWSGYNQRGGCYVSKGEYDKAIADYNTAISLNSNTGMPYYNRGVVYDTVGEYDKAIADYTRAIAIEQRAKFPDERTVRTAFLNRGLAYEKKKDYPRAITDYTEAIRLAYFKTDRAEIYVERGAAYNAMGDWEKALEDFTEAARLDPNNPHAANNAEAIRRKMERWR